MIAVTVAPDPSWVAGGAMLITAIVGVFGFRLSRKAEAVKESVGGANTAIHGLEILAQQHAKEIARLEQRHETCEGENAALRQTLARMEGQIGVLDRLTTHQAAITAATTSDIAGKVVSSARRRRRATDPPVE
ncbi:MAG TPA: hypothetical protein VIN56_10130 [Candidatus Dormibacteraeota bacterium]|jgi:phage shock protein A